MRIENLELNGFKSFPDRTRVEFGEGISCVIGPNGSGKSNILDAIKWVIGEQSAKALRGGEMLDVIFAGSAQRSPVGFAEVTLTLTSDGSEPFPGEFARFTELQVGRRLHRTGASEYFINQTRCRRKDITELFLDTGVGSDLYCFIEQGSVGKIVHATPLERRALIEEAAGISRYKARRHEAQARLLATATQLDRAADVAEEMAKRLRILEGQVVRAARYRHLRALIRQQEILLALARYADLAAERRALRKDEREAHARVDTVERELRRLDGLAFQRKEELAVVEEALATWRAEVAEQDARIRELEASLTHLGRRDAELGEEAKRLSAEAAELRGSQREAEQLVAHGVVALERLAVEAAEAGAAQEQADHALARALVAASAHRAALDGARHAQAATQARLEASRARLVEVEARLVTLPAERAANAAELEAAVEALAQAGATLASARRAAEAAKVVVAAREATAAQAQAQAAALAQQVGEAAAATTRAARAVEQARSERAEALKRAEQAVDAADRAVEQTHSDALEAAREATERARADADRQIRAATEQVPAALRAASARARQWIDALAHAGDTEREALLTRLRNALDAARADQKQQIDRATADGQARQAEVEARESERVHSTVARLEAARADAWQRVEALRQLIDSEREALGAAELERQRLQGTLEGLDQRLAPPVPALAKLPRLLDTLDAATRSDPARLAALGDRLNLPVVSPKVVLDLAGSLGGRRVRVLLTPAGEHGTLPGVAFVASLQAALDHFRTTGGAAAVLGTGERIDADGVVTLGARAPEAELMAERDRAREDLAAQERRIEALEQALATLADQREQALRFAEQCDADRAQGEQQVRADARERVEAARSQALQAVDGARAASEVHIEAARDVLAQASDQHRARVDARLAEARREGDEALEALREAEELRVQEQVAAIRATLAAEEARLQQGVVDARTKARARAEQARAALQRLREDQEGLVTLQQALGRAQEAEVEARGAREAYALLVAEALAAAGEAKVALVRATGEVEVAEATLRTAEAARRAAQSQGAALDAATERAEQEAAQLRGELTVLATGEGPDLVALEAAVAEADSAASQARDAASETAVRRATLTERIQGREQALAHARERGRELAERLAAIAAREQEVLKSTLETREALGTADSAVGEARTQRDHAWDRLQRERERLAGLREAVETLDQQIGHATTERDEGSRHADELSLRIKEVQVEVEGLRQRMDERYLLSLPGLLDLMDAQGKVLVETEAAAREGLVVGRREVPGVPDLVITPRMLSDFEAIEALVQELGGHREALVALGEVNLAALDEYTDVNKRHSALVEQREDLEQSMARIRSAIAKMNRTSRQRFRDTYDRVAANLEVIYPRLTGGGTARLALTDEEDLLETGVEIFVQPPGKRLQNLTLLSGGEKAMTAIAMLFALFQVKPSPFCVLDEVDAPLDEANGSRFNEVVREMSALAQFILITHNRKTMEAADTLYGITMPTPGVSRLVSVRLEA